MIRLLVAALPFAATASVQANPLDSISPLEYCEMLAGTMGSAAPKVIAPLVTMSSVQCRPAEPKNLISMRIDIDLEQDFLMSSGKTANIREYLAKSVCTSKHWKEIFARVDMEYKIYSAEQSLLQRFTLDREQCQVINALSQR